jgi:hypothetical protein
VYDLPWIDTRGASTASDGRTLAWVALSISAARSSIARSIAA